MFDLFPDWLKIFFLSMIPWLESRYIIPIALLSYHFNWWQVMPIAILGNMLPVPFILLFFKFIEKYLRRFNFWSNVMNWLFDKTRKKADIKIRRYEHIGLLLFVAVPLPFTGAWTGSLIAYLFDLKFGKSLITIFIGVIIAASIMTILALTGHHLFILFNGK